MIAGWFGPGALAAAAPPQPAAAVTVLARALQPGEPVRLLVKTERSVETVQGRWLEQSLAFFPLDAGQRQWSAWAVIPLSARAGLTTAEVDVTFIDGAVVHLQPPIAIKAKRFPEERLEVAPKFVDPPQEVQQRIAREQELLATIYTRRSTPSSRLQAFVRPVPGESNSVFGKRRFFNGKQRDPHPGIDLRAASGTPVRSSAAGTVVVARDLYYSGNTVIVDHGGGLFTVYAHLSRIDVSENAAIAAAASIGLSGATGRVTGPHLHWGAKLGSLPFDPSALLDPRLFPVL
jgi:murein DD-endopeptidase MepM/ murein hydrolase activator NlpD